MPPSQLNQWLYCSAAERPALSITTTGSADKGKEGPCGPSSTTPQVNVRLDYFFFDFDLLDDADAFFELALEDFFELANALTTFHAVRDLTVAPSWQIYAGLFRRTFFRGRDSAAMEVIIRPSSISSDCIHCAFDIVREINMRSINNNVKRFVKLKTILFLGTFETHD